MQILYILYYIYFLLFSPTLYIGEHVHGLYATRSLVDQNVVTITASDSGPLLLGGPHAPASPKIYQDRLLGHNYWLPKGSNCHLLLSLTIVNDIIFFNFTDFFNEDYPNFQSYFMYDKQIIIFTGHYNIPQFSTQKLLGTGGDLKLITDESSPKQNSNADSIEERTSGNPEMDIKNVNGSRKNLRRKFSDFYNDLKSWINQQENKGLKLTLIILMGCVITMFWYLQIQVSILSSVLVIRDRL